MRLASLWSAACLLVATALTNQAAAASISIETDQSVAMVISSLPGAIIVGNPAIADVTIQGNKLLLHGRSFGTTNVIVLDQDGEQISAMEVSVKHTVDNTVALFKANTPLGASRFSLNCAPLCESEFQIGDNAGYTETLTKQTKDKSKLVTGQEDAKSEAPPAPQ